ncbi:MAG: hypothetical protein KC517_02030 [Bacteroidetes bacterium]|nr:hypothetical protein [Bacteroidota bacterium]
MSQEKWPNKTAVHFGITNTLSDEVQFDGEKDADYFHLFAKQKGYDSELVLSSKTPIGAKHIKQQLLELKENTRSNGLYFISISGLSYVERSRFNPFKRRRRNKSLLLSGNEVFTKQDLIECLSVFDADDRVFFLVSDCETKGQIEKTSVATSKFEKQNVITKAAVLSLGFNPRAMKHLNISSGALDFEYATKTANTFQDVLDNLDSLNASNMKYVNSDLGCYNTHKNGAFVL